MPFIDYESRKILFVHIPKCGGSSIEQWLEGYGQLQAFCTSPVIGPNALGLPETLPCTPQHLMYSELERFFGPDYFDYKFTIVRNPYDRVASEFKFKLMIDRDYNLPSDQTFSQWLAAITPLAEADPWHRDNHMRPQHAFFDASVRVYRFEDGLETIAAQASLEAGLPAPAAPLERVLDGSPFADKVLWAQDDIHTVQRLYAGDFEVLGYDANETPLVRA